LVLGKFVGISSLSWFAVKIGWAKLPNGVSWRHILGLPGWQASAFRITKNRGAYGPTKIGIHTGPAPLRISYGKSRDSFAYTTTQDVLGTHAIEGLTCPGRCRKEQIFPSYQDQAGSYKKKSLWS
jgi:hypothetical protein